MQISLDYLLSRKPIVSSTLVSDLLVCERRYISLVILGNHIVFPSIESLWLWIGVLVVRVCFQPKVVFVKIAGIVQITSFRQEMIRRGW